MLTPNAMLHKIFIIVTILILSFSKVDAKPSNLTSKILNDLSSKQLTLGVYVYNSVKGEICSINSDLAFPMQSVYKLPIAIAFLHQVDKGIFSLSDSIKITATSLLPNTWSPYRERFPQGGNISVYEYIQYVVALSDNNLCDLMINDAGGIDTINSFLLSKGINDIHIKNYERELKASWDAQFSNTATPLSTVNLLNMLWKGKLIKTDSRDVLWSIMKNTQTGSARNELDSNVIIGYKTGFSGKSTKGITAANNCVGSIICDDGSITHFAIFISNSSENEPYNYSLISHIIKHISTPSID